MLDNDDSGLVQSMLDNDHSIRPGRCVIARSVRVHDNTRIARCTFHFDGSRIISGPVGSGAAFKHDGDDPGSVRIEFCVFNGSRIAYAALTGRREDG